MFNSVTDQTYPSCVLCGQEISEEERDFCLANSCFNGQVFCSEHQKRFNACPAMRWQPGGRGSFR